MSYFPQMREYAPENSETAKTVLTESVYQLLLNHLIHANLKNSIEDHFGQFDKASDVEVFKQVLNQLVEENYNKRIAEISRNVFGEQK